MRSIGGQLGDTPLLWHVHLLRLMIRDMLDSGNDIDDVQKGIGHLYQRIGLGLIRKASGRAPLSMQAATTEDIRHALRLLVPMIEKSEHHPYDHFPHGWRESLRWAKERI